MYTRLNGFFTLTVTLFHLTSSMEPTCCKVERQDDVIENTELKSQLHKWKFDPILPEGCVPDCESEIYCHGEILHDFEMARIFPDSKTFVDMKLLYSEKEIVTKYRALKARTNNKPSIDHLKEFLAENFATDSFDTWVPSDFTETPSIANRIEDATFRKWLLSLNQIWKQLAMKMSKDVLDNPDRHSYLHVPKPFIKAGGRFTEMYYWDSYWVIKGLMLCDMFDTARGIIENMLWLVKTNGHMPNGNRKYYSKRSQPPLLIHMVAVYYSATKDEKFVKENLEYLDKEFQFWYNNRTVELEKDGEMYRMARYNASTCTPRPESYYEDFLLATKVPDPEGKRKLYTAIKSAAEGAWDFSSRFFVGPDGSNKGTLLNLETQNLIPVELNCILQANAAYLSEWYALFGNKDRSLYYRNISEEFLLAIEKVLWNEELGIWLDYDLILKKPRKYFAPTNLMPLWTGSYSKKPSYAEKALEYLRAEGIIDLYLNPLYYGTPSTTCKNGEQWNFPNCWPPLQAFTIQALERSGHPVALYTAFRMAQKWILTTYTGFQEHGYMFEKYCATEIGTTGGGGEYVPQTGFGWTNAFVMELFDMWGKFFNFEDIRKMNDWSETKQDAPRLV